MDIKDISSQILTLDTFKTKSENIFWSKVFRQAHD